PQKRFSVFQAGDIGTAMPISNTTVSGTTITITLASTPADSQALDIYYGWALDPVNQEATNGIYDDNANDGDGLTQGRQLTPSLAPITAAAPVPVTPPANQVGPNLNMVYATYQTGKTGFGKEFIGSNGAYGGY